MKRWLPNVRYFGASTSDNRGEDAEGGLVAIEWFGFIFEVALYRRGRA